MPEDMSPIPKNYGERRGLTAESCMHTHTSVHAHVCMYIHIPNKYIIKIDNNVNSGLVPTYQTFPVCWLFCSVSHNTLGFLIPISQMRKLRLRDRGPRLLKDTQLYHLLSGWLTSPPQLQYLQLGMVYVVEAVHTSLWGLVSWLGNNVNWECA